MSAEVAKKRGRPRKADVEVSKAQAVAKNLADVKPNSTDKARSKPKQLDQQKAPAQVSQGTVKIPEVKTQAPKTSSRAKAGPTSKTSSKILKALEESGASKPFTAPQTPIHAPLEVPVSLDSKLDTAASGSGADLHQTPLAEPSESFLGERSTDANLTTKNIESISTGADPPAMPVQRVPVPQIVSQTFTPTAALLKDKSPSKAPSIQATASSDPKPSSNTASIKSPPATRSSVPTKGNVKPPGKPPSSPSPPKPISPPRRDPMRPTIPSVASGTVDAKPKPKGLPGTYKQNARRITLLMVAIPVVIVTTYHLYERYVNGMEPKKLPRALTEPWDQKKVMTATKKDD
ncbi:hypothetical protein NA57DRAFT_52362 [Rhizodiscina lignyota]|uniref:Uncharacterized protein n=1 Tax=Rhizodiscina lignyota TaxID=1504668 RepID=A0A9P4IP43_9PEZI|nr:hypothetical protein NA57DRAFT_52362 [Rhizodiscina lignyota]